jgi:hypothetical protein
MSLTLRTVSFNFFRDIHPVHYQLCIEGTYAFLYFFRFCAENVGFFPKTAFLGMAVEIFKLRLLPAGKLRLSAVALCVLGCFLVWGLKLCESCDFRDGRWLWLQNVFTPLRQRFYATLSVAE